MWGPDGSTAEIEGTRWQSLQPKTDDEPPGPWVQSRNVVLDIEPDGIVVRGVWELRAEKPGLFVEQLLGPNAHIRKATLDGDRAWIWTTPDGIVVAGEVERRARLNVEAFLPSVKVGDDFLLLGASEGRVRLVDAENRRLRNADGSAVMLLGEEYITGSRSLLLEDAKPADPDATLLLVADVGIGLTVGESALAGQARVRWRLRRGSTKTAALDVRGLGDDLVVEGPNIADWSRSGDRIDITLKEEATTLIDATLRWSTILRATTEQTTTLPSVVASNVFRQRTSLQLATDGDLDVIPNLRGWAPIPARALPEFGRGLIRGNPTGAFSKKPGTTADDAVGLFRFEAAPGPPMVVEIADVQLAVSEEGRVLTKARYEVLNERAAFLEIEPPPGAKLVGVWLAGREVRAHRTEGLLRIPLKRSLETVQGLLTFPVEVAFLAETNSLPRKLRRTFDIPKPSAPVSVSRVQVRLPQRFRSLMESGKDGVVEMFDRGQEVAYGLEDANDIARADAAYQGAVDAWNRNEFEDASKKLEELEAIGAKGKNQVGLQSNVDLVTTTPTDAVPATSVSPDGVEFDSAPRAAVDGEPTVMKRRIRSRARARSSKRRSRQRMFKKKAKLQRDSGNFKEAEKSYRQAIEETRELRRLEDSPSSDYAFEADELEGELQGLQQEAAAREQLESGSVDQAEHAPFNRLELDPPPAAPAQPPVVAPLLMPRGGVVIRFQHVLLAPGAAPSIIVEARRRLRPLRSRRHKK